MSLAEKFRRNLVDAMRAKEELRLSVLRGIQAAIKHKEVEKIRPVGRTEANPDFANARKTAQRSIDHFRQRQPTRTRSPRKRKSSPSSNRICPPAPAKPKWRAAIAKASPNPRRDFDQADGAPL